MKYTDMLTPSSLTGFANDLRDLANVVERTAIDSHHEVHLPFSAFRDAYPTQALKELKDWSATKARYIYTFCVPDHACEPLHFAFEVAKQSKKGARAYCRLNAASPQLYVGSSLSLDSRIKQHLGFATKSIFAMQLCHWLPPGEGTLHIQAWRFDMETDPAIVQAIEDALWAANKPMFGRQGAR